MEKLEDEFTYIGENVEVFATPKGIDVKVKANHEDAWKEIEKVANSLPPEKASELIESFSFSSPKRKDATDPRHLDYYLEERLGSDFAAIFVPDEERKAIIEGAKRMLADQLKTYFLQYNRKKGRIFKTTTFSEFAYEIGRLYQGEKEIVRGAINLAYEDLRKRDPKIAEEFLKEVNEVEKRRKRKRMLLSLAVAGLILGGASLALYIQNQKPLEIKKVEYKDKVNRGENQEFTVIINSKNPIQSVTLNLNGTSIDVPLTQDFGNGTLLYKTSFNPSSISPKEGRLIGEVVVKDQRGNEVKQPISSLVNLEAPVIKDIKVEDLGSNTYRVSASIDEPNLKEAYLEFPNGNKIPLVKMDGKYAANVTSKDKKFVLKSIDKYNLTSSVPIEITPRKLFESWLPSNFDRNLSLNLFDSSPIFREIFEKDKTLAQDILTLAHMNGSYVPKNLAYVILDQIERDPTVNEANKITLVKKVIPYFLDFGKKIQRIDSVWLVNNASMYGFRDLEGLKRAAEFSENTNISLNFEKRLTHSALADIGYYFPKIFKYPYEAKYLAIQVADTIYLVECTNGEKFSISALKGKDYVWNGLILPYSKWRFERLENGTFDSLDYKFKEGELAKLAKWAGASVVDAAARSLYPFDELMDHDLLGFDPTRFFHDRKIMQALERGVSNMSFNSTIGNSPFGYIYDLLKSDMKEKNDRYVDAYSGFWSNPPHGIWIHSSSFWKMKVGEYYQRTPESRALVEQDPETTIIRGYPAALSIYDIPVNSHFYLSGQSDPYVSKIIGAMLNRAVVVLRAPYPTSPDGKHDEPFIVSKNGKLIGFWYKLDKFLDDYNPEKNPMANDYWKTNKPWIEVEIVSDASSRKFEYQDLSKVLNP